MKKFKKLIVFALIFTLVLAMGQAPAFADSDNNTSTSGISAWFCQLVGDQDVPVSDDSAVFKLVASFTMPDGEESTKTFIENNKPYIYVTKNGSVYEKAPFTYNEEKHFGVAAMTIYGYGEYNGMVCCNESDGVSAACGADGTSPSTFMLYSFDGGLSTKISYNLNGESVEGLWELITGMPSFSDVSPRDWFYKSVTEAYKSGLITGKTADKFAPADSMSCAEAVTLAARLHAKYYNKTIPTEKNDGEPWYQPYINYASSNGIPCRFSNYNAEINRTDFVSVFYASMPEDTYTEINTIEDGAIPDVPMYAVSASKIYSFYRAGILSGSSVDGSFLPYSKIKRSEVAAIVCRLLGQDRKVFFL